MTRLSAFGLFAVTAMLVCYAFERRSPWFILGFALACALGSVYGFMQGAWPLAWLKSSGPPSHFVDGRVLQRNVKLAINDA